MKSQKLEEATMLALQGKLKKVESEKDMSLYKQNFIDYCKGKIKDLGFLDVEIDAEIYSAKVLFEEEWQKVKNAVIIDGYDINADDNFVVVNPQTKEIMVNTPMTFVEAEIARLEFSYIDTECYNLILENWEDSDMPYLIQDLARKEK